MKRPVTILLALCGTLASIRVAGQTASSLSLSGLTTNVLSPPGAPSTFSSPGCGGGTSDSWSYAIVAVDGTGATTQGGTSAGTNNNCVSLSPTSGAYITFHTPPVAGSASCLVYRTATPSGSSQNIGLLPTPFVCGQPFIDNGLYAGDLTSPPSLNSTGSVSASGNVTAATFQSTGVGSAGTSVWFQGSQLTGCGTALSPISPPCIPTAKAFFLDAPTMITQSYGWTANASPNTGYQLLYLDQPGTALGSVATSQLEYVAAGSSNQVLLGNTSAAPSFGTVPNAALQNSSTTVNGQTCMLGSSCNVNSGATAHSLAVNEGNGIAIAGAGPGNNGQVTTSAGSGSDPTFKDLFPVFVIPAANQNAGTPANSWSLGTCSATARTGTNAVGGTITCTSSQKAYLNFYLSQNWDTAVLPYIRFDVFSTDGGTGHTIIPSVAVYCAKGDGSTTDDGSFAAAQLSSTILLPGFPNRESTASNVQFNSTSMSGCQGGSVMHMQIGVSGTGTATNVQFYAVMLTVPTLNVAGAQ
jgi:hypothetical protein